MRQFHFDAFRLDPARRELWRGDERLALPPKAFDCIAYLIEHRTRAVGRDELISAVWGRTEVSDNLLDQVMLRARRTLGDTDEERRMIRTVPRFGYAWVVPTRAVEDASATASEPVPVVAETLVAQVAEASEAVNATPPPPSRPARARIRAAAALVAVLLLAIAAAAWMRSAPRTGANGSPPTRAPQANLALLLPVVIDADSAYAWARLGAMELIAERLRGAGQAMVPSDNVIALVREWPAGSADAVQVQRVAAAASASLVLQARAVLSAGYWRVSVQSLHGRAPPLLAEGEARDLLEAAQAAADRTAEALGLAPPRAGDLLSPRERALGGLLQQVEAAMLADQPDTARALLDSLDAEQAARADVRFRRATLDFRSGRLDAAQSAFEALLAATSAADDPLFRARVLNGLGNVALRRDDYAAVVQRSDAVVALLGTATPSPELGHALTGRAIAHSARFEFDAAVADFAQARVVLESVGDRLGLARVGANLGILEARRDRYADALPLLAASAAQLATFHDLTSELFARVAAAYAHLLLLEPAAALPEQARLRELIEREPNPQWKRYAMLARTDVLAANGRSGEAQALLQRALDEATAAGDAALLGSARVIAARAALAAGAVADAARDAGEVVNTAWNAETPREQAGAWLTLMRAQIAGKQVEAARASAQALSAWAQRDGSAVAALYATLARAEQQAAAGDAVSAHAQFAAALSQADTLRVPEDILSVCTAYAQALLDRGEAERAGAIAARSAAWAQQSYEAALLQVRVYHALGRYEAWRDALEHARHLAGERVVPAELARAPERRGAG